jgi:hypothetical protein
MIQTTIAECAILIRKMTPDGMEISTMTAEGLAGWLSGTESAAKRIEELALALEMQELKREHE